MEKTANRFISDKLSLCRVAIIAIFVAIFSFVYSVNAAAKNVTDNFKVTEVHLYRGSGYKYELNVKNGAATNAYFRAVINWEYNSEEPIENGDTVSFRIGSGSMEELGTEFIVRNSKALDVISSNNEKIGTWEISSKKVKITFSDAAVGQYSLSGVISTSANNSVSGGYVTEDKVVKFPVADKYVEFTKLKVTTINALPDDAYTGTIPTNGLIYYVYRSPGITANEVYRGNNQTPLTDKAKFSNLIYENTLSEHAISSKVYIFASVPLPYDFANYSGSGGASKSSVWLNITKLFTQKTQSENQTYEEFYDSLQSGEYGVYIEKSGRRKVVVKLGSQPSNITYTQALVADGRKVSRVGELYSAVPEIVDTMNILDDPNGVTAGKVVHFIIQVNENIPSSVENATSTYTYINEYENSEGNTDSSSMNNITIDLGTATATINERPSDQSDSDGGSSEDSDSSSDDDAPSYGTIGGSSSTGGNTGGNSGNNGGNTGNTSNSGNVAGTSGNASESSDNDMIEPGGGAYISDAESAETIASDSADINASFEEIIDEILKEVKSQDSSASAITKTMGAGNFKTTDIKVDKQDLSRFIILIILLIILMIISYKVYQKTRGAD